MATGTQAASYMRNLPPAGSFRIDPNSFFSLTERNDLPLTPQAFPGFGSFFEQRLNNVGILAGITLTFEGTLTSVGAAAYAPTHRWPYGLLTNVQINANGQNNLIAVDGMDLKARERRVFRNAPDLIDTAPTVAGSAPLGAAGSAQVRLTWQIPVSHDDTTLIGSIFAQSDESYLSMRLSFASQPAAASGDLFVYTAGTSIALTGTIYPTLTFYEIPIGPGAKGGSEVILPDLSMLHGMVAVNQGIVGVGDTVASLLRTAGQLLCVYTRLDNGANSLDVLDPLVLQDYRLRYGGNQIPREYAHAALGYKNQRDYDGPVSAALCRGTANSPFSHLFIAPRYLVLDLEVDNPLRDVILPKGVIDLQQIFTIANGVTINAGAQAHQVEEILFGGA